MKFSGYQSGLWNDVLISIEKYKAGKVLLEEVMNDISGLEIAIHFKEYAPLQIPPKWFDLALSLENHYAVRGNNIDPQEIIGYLNEMTELMNQLHPIDEDLDEED